MTGASLLLIFGSILLAACSALGIGPSSTPTPTAAPEAESAAAVNAEGQIVPHHYANLSTEVSGQVTEILFHEGEQVQSGAVILRLGDREQYQADLAAAELELLSAQQALEELQKNAGLELAQARQSLALANQERSIIFDEFENLSKPVPQADLDQAYASVIMAEKRLQKAGEDLEKMEKRYKNKNNILWQFLNKKQFKDLLEQMRRARLSVESRYYDVLERYNDLKNHPDEIDLAKATADLGLVDARIADIKGDIALLEKGPDPDKVASAEARRKAAQVALEAAHLALTNSEIVAPFSGQIAELTITEGEWVQANQPVIVLADLNQWEVETDDLTELDVPDVRLGQIVTVRLDALPELELKGKVGAIKDLSEEKRGDVTYTVTILLDQVDPRLRWGMTVSVDFGE
ncbi:MAG: hypothetical protein A2W36_06580 [Chloroflexi bacterium RBG_16_58_14]|nr:MAG: hypothetical protein A2W36_06580 [Chloroflexi bacterium RBG_16_58_14]